MRAPTDSSDMKKVGIVACAMGVIVCGSSIVIAIISEGWFLIGLAAVGAIALLQGVWLLTSTVRVDRDSAGKPVIVVRNFFWTRHLALDRIHNIDPATSGNWPLACPTLVFDEWRRIRIHAYGCMARRSREASALARAVGAPLSAEGSWRPRAEPAAA